MAARTLSTLPSSGLAISVKDLFDVACSGPVVPVATDATFVGLGSDTGGSQRIPAALCSIVGFQSTARTVPARGCAPLSSSLETAGVLTQSVRDAIGVH
jgi:aspartyl-tRNA(Asn)/glutamyl-tRNA(Gln) amidotransferase subunit A